MSGTPILDVFEKFYKICTHDGMSVAQVWSTLLYTYPEEALVVKEIFGKPGKFLEAYPELFEVKKGRGNEVYLHLQRRSIEKRLGVKPPKTITTWPLNLIKSSSSPHGTHANLQKIVDCANLWVAKFGEYSTNEAQVGGWWGDNKISLIQHFESLGELRNLMKANPFYFVVSVKKQNDFFYMRNLSSLNFDKKSSLDRENHEESFQEVKNTTPLEFTDLKLNLGDQHDVIINEELEEEEKEQIHIHSRDKTGTQSNSKTLPKSCKILIAQDGIDKLLEILPKKWHVQFIEDTSLLKNLCEIEIQLGWPPHLYYFKQKGFKELEHESIPFDFQHILTDRQVLVKNRSFIEGTLHRISVTKGFKKDEITAVTLRIGRPIIGISDIFDDLIDEGKSILFIGPPGLGKTSMIRDLARNISGKMKKTIVIDSSCEISGYTSHPVIGKAYVMFVPEDSKKEDIMIQAIENRTPEVLIVDEISNIQELNATQTASTRGVILYATAHGTLKDIKKSTIVLKLLGGVTSVTLGDDKVSENNGEKTKLESKSPPLFDIVVEFSKKEKFTWFIYKDIPYLAKCLFGKSQIQREVRTYDENAQTWSGKIETIVIDQ